MIIEVRFFIDDAVTSWYSRHIPYFRCYLCICGALNQNKMLPNDIFYFAEVFMLRSKLTDVCFLSPNWQQASIGSVTVLVPNMQQAITCTRTNDEPVQWRTLINLDRLQRRLFSHYTSPIRRQSIIRPVHWEVSETNNSPNMPMLYSHFLCLGWLKSRKTGRLIWNVKSISSIITWYRVVCERKPTSDIRLEPMPFLKGLSLMFFEMWTNKERPCSQAARRAPCSIL